MKKLTNFERKHLLLGILLMFGVIIFYVYCNKDVDSVSVFRIFFPIFWGLYTIIAVSYIMLTGWLNYKTLEGQKEESQEEIKSELCNRRFLESMNIITAITIVFGYISSTFKDILIQYTTYQPLVWTIVICLEITMYILYLFKEETSEEPKVEEDVEKVEGVQLISYEDAIKLLEEQGYEIEDTVKSHKEESEISSKEETVEESLPAVRETSQEKNRLFHRCSYRSRKNKD